ncbi:peptidoglycan-associated lipoprotein Pal [Colwellia sp. 4_MG-2023]|jgi:peptidoglycan-associated lipoprotein|uniref:peptidoglycan-associated lipoprotein Pal n=1 Tax=unclassified Colwellia TaxID=196834 RepID=UPI001C099BE5|nr:MULTISPECIES: peptidoglycan-associated lipoprotein Pal [unclassified Colwellia]MBU2924544.1 peptidoglycan-associated lipoprotein Pal [Colwellia sp. C2M11]MDO6489057.1 peptidoglycan-associated lipoprotein Pal [Colwellia sp. 6_MG-2023]MDO6508348.1 peptidoglycan-associated lipoprotein Pal [Colwellia sp. 5_MG-2023]MDO6557006.1 peptidoglycan-associated lipoprotein Pal [Colwellia sp. 4_MG-2023]MDO6653981.1 peptidoglycan-associated lipoprotein Pal [Colwellia sp. 3_MG-2023]
MILNKTLKNVAIALPMLALAACSSNDSSDEQVSVDSNVEMVQEQQAAAEEAVRVQAAKRAAEIKEQERQQLAMLRSEHIIYFGFDVSSVSSEFSDILNAHAKFLNANPGVKVLIEGHADERGTPEYNIALSERRAKAVVTYLENMGVSADQLSIVSYGEEKPMIKDRSEEAFSKNRRAVIVY